MNSHAKGKEGVIRPEGRLEIAAGFASATGPRPDNQDFGGVRLGGVAEQATHGVVAAVADGVGGARGGRVAAELAVRSFVDGYLAQPPTLGVQEGAVRAIRAFNRWLHATGRSDPALEGAAATFTALVLRGREATLLHVGDSRAWLWRGGELRLLTEDHTLPQPDLRHVLYRALGVEAELRVDVATQRIEPHDRLLLTTDGVHGPLSRRTLGRMLAERGSVDADAQALVAAALAAGGQDNATAVLIDVVSVPPADAATIGAEAARLPVLPPPNVGEMVDGFAIEKLLSDGRYSRTFLARDHLARDGREALVLKFPKPALLSEAGARGAFLREQLIGQHLDSPFVARTLALAPERQSRLYVAQPFYAGETLEARIARGLPGVAAGVSIAAKLGKGVAALHRRSVIHRDIKPDNVLLTEDGGLKLIDLGVARLPRVPEFDANEIPGTPSYMAPELFDGAPGDEKSDQFALGVTIYRTFTGHYPFGEVEAFSRPRFGTPAPPSHHRPDLPAWLDATILRTLAIDPAQRFGDVLELVHRLGSGEARAVQPRRRAPLLERDPAAFWRGVAILLALALVAALIWR